MTMNLHTQTTAPKAAPATSVSPLEQSGSPKTKFPEIKTVKTAVVKLISDIEGNLDQRLAYREAVEGLCQEAANRITQCMHSRSTGQTLRDLRELLSVTLDTIIVVEFEGEQTRLNYGGRSSIGIKIPKRLKKHHKTDVSSTPPACHECTAVN